MMKRLCFKVLIIFIVTISFAQAQSSQYSLKNNLYMAYGSQFGIGVVDLGAADLGFFDIGFHFNARYNIYNFTDNLSIGIEVAPEVGFYGGSIGGFSNTGRLGIHIPILLSGNVGVGSTFDSDSNIGLGLKGGIELFTGPYLNDFITDVNKVAVVPVLQLSIRYWKARKNRLREVFLRVGGRRPDSASTFISEGASFVIYAGGSYFIGY